MATIPASPTSRPAAPILTSWTWSRPTIRGSSSWSSSGILPALSASKARILGKGQITFLN